MLTLERGRDPSDHGGRARGVWPGHVTRVLSLGVANGLGPWFDPGEAHLSTRLSVILHRMLAGAPAGRR